MLETRDRAVLQGKGEEVGREVRDLAVAAAGRLKINFPEDPAFPSFRSRLAAPRPVPPPLGAFCCVPGWDSDFNPTGPKARETPGSAGVASAEVVSCREDYAKPSGGVDLQTALREPSAASVG